MKVVLSSRNVEHQEPCYCNKAGELNLQASVVWKSQTNKEDTCQTQSCRDNVDHQLSSCNQNKCSDVNDAPRDPETWLHGRNLNCAQESVTSQ